MKQKRTLIIVLLLGFALSLQSTGFPWVSPRQDQVQKEEEVDYFKKWLTQDVVYIINRQEKEVFQSLNSDEEREQFIEQFWFRRDPDPTTPTNEFKEEHYRRIAYANERFRSGAPGWKTDRGRIYILWGPPDTIEPHPSGGPYDRSVPEGGGTTVTFPFEVWRYRHIDGIGDDILLEFVDPSYSGEYRLALDPDEKDAFAKVPTLGETWDEMEGLVSKAARGTRDDMRNWGRRDQPFDRYYRYTQIQRPRPIKYKDLQEAVKVNVSYGSSLPFKVRTDYFNLGADQVLVPITIEIEDKDLTLVENEGNLVANVAVYGLVTSLTGQVVSEFDDDLVNSLQPDRPAHSRSLYQKLLPLQKKSRYKLDLVVKDLNADKISVVRQAIVPPPFAAGNLEASSLILSDFVQLLNEIPKDDQMFVIGDVWIRPSLGKVFSKGQPISAYVQLYNFALDQAMDRPSVSVTFELRKGPALVAAIEDTDGDSIQYYSDTRVVLIRTFPTQDLEPGEYGIVLRIHDKVKDESVTISDNFELKAEQG